MSETLSQQNLFDQASNEPEASLESQVENKIENAGESAGPVPAGPEYFLTENLNPEQTAAVMAPVEMGVKVLAGAGTGKTTLITRRFVRLGAELSAKGIASPYEKILAVTFTVKAADEMRERILALLGQQAARSGSTPVIAVATEGATSNTDASAVSQVLSSPVPPSPEALWVGTFHNLCKRILEADGSRMGLKTGFDVLDDLNEQLLFNRLLHGLRNGSFQEIPDVLAAADLAEKIPADIFDYDTLSALPFENLVALLEKLPALIRKIKAAGLSPREFYDLAREQTAHVTQALKQLPVKDPVTGELLTDSHQQYARLWDGYFHPWKDDGYTLGGTAEEQARFTAGEHRKAERQGKAYNPKIGEAEDYFRMRLKWLYDIKYEGEKVFIDYSGIRKNDAFRPGSGNTEFLDILAAKEFQVIDLAAAAYALYQSLLRESNACDFDDLINETLRLLRLHPDIGEKYREQFHAVIVDEFQDSNGAQLRLLSELLGPDRQCLTVVGDEKQSIYAFRFAQPENMGLVFDRALNFPGQTGGPRPVREITLQHNYRSLPPIVQAANHLTRKIVSDDSQNLVAARAAVMPESAAPGADESSIAAPNTAACVTWLTLGKILTTPEGKTVNEPIADVKAREAAYIATEIETLLKQTSNVSDPAQTQAQAQIQTAPKKYRAGDIAVLVKNHGKAEKIHQALIAKGIPAVKQKNRFFFQEAVIKNAMALLRILATPEETASWVRVLATRLNQRQLKQLVETRRELKISLYQLLLKIQQEPNAMSLPGFSAETLKAMASLVEAREVAARKQKDVSPMLQYTQLVAAVGVIHPETPALEKIQQRKDFRMFKQLMNSLEAKSEALHTSLSEMVEILSRYETDASLDLPTELTAENEEAVAENAVQIMTVHGSKGLEFPVVFVAWTDSGRSRRFEDSTVMFEPQYPGKAGFGVFLGKDPNAPGSDTLKKQVFSTLWQKPRQDAETRRLFYVALTRAKDRLTVIRSRWAEPWTEPPADDAVNILTEETDD